MKSAIAILATVFAVSAFAQAPAKKEEAKPAAPATPTVTVTAPAKAEVKKEEKKPAKSDGAKKDASKADAKPAVPAK